MGAADTPVIDDWRTPSRQLRTTVYASTRVIWDLRGGMVLLTAAVARGESLS